MQTVQQATKHVRGLEHWAKPDASTIRITGRPLRRGPGAAFLFLDEYRIPPPGLPGGERAASRASALFNVQHVFNNPVKYQDPSGNRACSDEEAATGDESCDQNRTAEELKETISSIYGWQIAEEMSIAALWTVLEAGQAISEYVSDLTGANGDEWVRTYLGEATIYGGSLGKQVTDYATNQYGSQIAGIVPFYTDIFLMQGFTAETLVHELGHVLDNTLYDTDHGLPNTWVGGGAADRMLNSVGGNPEACPTRYDCGMSKQDYALNVAGSDAWPGNSYGNNSVADDFAESFANAVFGDFVPPGRLLYIEVMIIVAANPISQP